MGLGCSYQDIGNSHLSLVKFIMDDLFEKEQKLHAVPIYRAIKSSNMICRQF